MSEVTTEIDGNFHVAKTIEFLEQRKGQLEDLIARLRGMHSAMSLVAAADRESPAQTATIPGTNGNHGSAPPKAKVQSPKAKVAGRPAGRRGDADRIIQVAAGMAEPLRVTALSNAAKIPKSSAKSTFDRWQERGWLTKIAYGEYKRTKTFGATRGEKAQAGPAKVSEKKAAAIKLNRPVLPPSERPTTIPTGSPEQLRKELENAKQQLAHAKANGRDMMVDMFQQEVERLESALQLTDD